MKTHSIKIVMVIVLFSIPIYTETAYPGKLARLWGELIKTYPPPNPTQEERKTLAWAYEQLAKAHEQETFKKTAAIDEIIKPEKIPEPEKFQIYHKRLKPFASMIHKASIQFDVPEKIIGAVILQESAGNPKAKAKTSSAKGLMQTIDGTFNLAVKHLAKLGIKISNPYKAKDSITAGTWYLSYVFEMAKQDYPGFCNRKNLKMWKKALEYYYAGPKFGKDPNKVVHARIGGKTIVIKKDWYANKVLKRAYAL